MASASGRDGAWRDLGPGREYRGEDRVDLKVAAGNPHSKRIVKPADGHRFVRNDLVTVHKNIAAASRVECGWSISPLQKEPSACPAPPSTIS